MTQSGQLVVRYEKLVVNVGFTPRAIGHMRRNWLFSSSGVAKTSGYQV